MFSSDGKLAKIDHDSPNDFDNDRQPEMAGSPSKLEVLLSCTIDNLQNSNGIAGQAQRKWPWRRWRVTQYWCTDDRKMAAETGNTYISGSMTATKIRTTNPKNVSKWLRQQWTTRNGKMGDKTTAILQFTFFSRSSWTIAQLGQLWTYYFAWVLWHCWLGDRNGIQPVKSPATTLFLVHRDSMLAVYCL